MRKRIAAIIAVAVTLAFGGTASAVVYGQPDGNDHPSVGALLAPQAYSDGTWASCTGTLISPTVFLTAAHCDWGLDRMAVTFDSVYDSTTGTEHWGAWHADPRFRGAQGDPYDLAVVVLDDPVGVSPARLPTAGSLSNLSRTQGFTSVGYGAQAVTIDHWSDFPLCGHPLRGHE